MKKFLILLTIIGLIFQLSSCANRGIIGDDFVQKSELCWSSLKNKTIQWASKVISYSSEFTDYNSNKIIIVNGEWRFLQSDRSTQKQILGKPTVMPQGGSSDFAWCPQYKNGLRKNGYTEFIKVGFEHPMRIKQVIIAENSNPGSIEQVFIYDESGNDYEVYNEKAEELITKTRMLNISFPITDSNIAAVKIVMNCKKVQGFNEIDAIGISDSDQEYKMKINLPKILNFNENMVNLGEQINGENYDLFPRISPDGKHLFFIKYDSSNQGGIGDQDVWTSDIDSNGNWQKCYNLGKAINTKQPNAVISVLPDGSILLNRIYNTDSTSKSGFSKSKQINGNWTFPLKFKKSFKNSMNSNGGFYISNDEKYFIISVKQKDSYGNLDIYVCFRENDTTWSNPVNLGPIINTSGKDFGPFLASDLKTLYFSSDGHPGFGNADIFMSRRLDNTWQNWSEPVNIGKAINDQEWNAYFSIPASGDYAYFSSHKNSFGKSDIYKILLPPYLRPQPVGKVSGIVTSKMTHKPIPSRIVYETIPSEPNDQFPKYADIDKVTGKYTIFLPSKHKYVFKATADNHISLIDTLDLTKLNKYNEYKINIALYPYSNTDENGESMKLENVLFKYASIELDPKTIGNLDEVIKLLISNPEAKIVLEGYTDNRGRAKDNLLLSQKRTEKIRDIFADKGIRKSRIKCFGYGEEKSICSEDNEDCWAKNRRVEFHIHLGHTALKQ